MKPKHVLIALAISALALPSLALAGNYHGTKAHGMGNWDMTVLDTNKDGVLTFEEYSAPNVEKWRSGFKMIDTSGDGRISAEEWRAFLDVHGMKSER
jgi:hypothetical protein